MHIASEARLHELGIELPEQLPVIGSYRLAKRHRDIIYERMLMTTASITPRFGELAGDLEAGTGDGRAALVFLPGLTFDRTMWRPVLRSLRTIDPGRTTLTLDMPGEGESIGTFRGLEVAIDQLHVAIAAAGIEKPVLVGHSGSAIGAMFYAMKYPVRGIVNVDAVLDNNAFSARLRARRLRRPTT